MSESHEYEIVDRAGKVLTVLRAANRKNAAVIAHSQRYRLFRVRRGRP